VNDENPRKHERNGEERETKKVLGAKLPKKHKIQTVQICSLESGGKVSAIFQLFPPPFVASSSISSFS
jgi:hypothetical protein